MNILDKFAPQRKVLPEPSGFVTFPHTTYAAQRSAPIGQAYADIHFVYEIVGDISVSGSTLPLKVFQLDSTGERKENMTHPGYQLLRKPNTVHDSTLFYEILYASRLMFGEWFIVKVGRNPDMPVGVRNPPVMLWPIRPERMMEVPDPETGNLLGWFMRVSPGEKIPLLASDVIHNRRYSPVSDYRGFSPIEALRYQVELGRDTEQAGIELYQNGLFTRGVLTSKKKIGPTSIKRVAEEFREMLIGPGRRWKIPILDEEMDFKALQLSPQDAQWLETVKVPRERVAAAFGYPLPELYPQSNPEDIRRARYSGAVQPLVVSMEQSFEAHLFSDWRDSAFPEFQLSHILDADFPTQITAFKEAILSGQMTPNEVRRKLNLPPIDGGDDLYVPLNMEALGNIGGPEPRTRDSAGGQGGDQGRTGSHTGTQAALEAPRARKLKAKRVPKLAEALERRLRGVLKREMASLGQSPTASDVEGVLRATEPEIGKLLHQFIGQGLDAGAEDVEYLTGTPPDVEKAVSGVQNRAEELSKAFSNERGGQLVAQLASKAPISEVYADLEVDGWATEAVTWGYEQAAGMSPSIIEAAGGDDMDTKLLLAAIASHKSEPVHVHLPDVRYEPEFKIEPPEVKVNVEAPQITVNPPEVHVAAPEVVVNVPEPRKTRKIPHYDDNGRIDYVDEE